MSAFKQMGLDKKIIFCHRDAFAKSLHRSWISQLQFRKSLASSSWANDPFKKIVQIPKSVLDVRICFDTGFPLYLMQIHLEFKNWWDKKDVWEEKKETVVLRVR